ncbi:hypothetical protein [Stenotrophomonas sp. TWI587]|uniref:hypothetical protein n=1 Tax=Stenotrophomonas sp. TWI587 TaxID=3136783 RepID=UPI00320B730A
MSVTTAEQFYRAQSVRRQAIACGWDSRAAVGQLVRAGYSKEVQNRMAARALAARPAPGGDAA